MAKKAITEAQLRAANKAGYSTQQIAQEVNKFEKRTWNDAVYSGALPNGQTMNPELAPQPAQPVQTQPIKPVVNENTIDTNTGKPVSESTENAQYNILPESVTGIKPTITPALQAKIDAKKNWVVSAVVPTETIAPVETATPEVVPTEVKAETVTTPTEVKTEVTDIEKNAQATGVEYTMQNWQATYNPKTTEEAAKILAMGGKLAGETKMSAVAQASLNKVRGLGQMTDQQLANNIAGGQVSNKELELLNTMNPQLVAQAKELSKKKIITNTTNEIQSDNSAIIRGEEPTGMSKPLQDLVNKLATIDADTKSPAEMKTAYQDAHPEMIQSRDQINELTKQKRDLQLAKMNLWKEWKEKNSSYPISMIMAGYSAASRDLDNSIYLINDDLNTEISNYNMYLDDMNAEIDFDIAQQGKEEQRLFDIYGVTSKEQIRNEDIAREDARIEQSIQLEEQRYQRDIERDDMKSAQERKYKIEDMKNEMNMNIETGLMNLGVDPTGMTPEEMRATYAQATGFYKQQEMNLAQQKLDIEAYNANRSKASDYLKTTITNEDWSTREVFVNPMTGEQIDPAQAFWNANIDVGQVLSGYSAAGQELLSVPDGTIIPTRLGQVSPQNASIRGKECAEYVNDILGERKLWSTYASKLAVCDEPTGWIWSVVAWKPNGSGSFGHTGIIVGEDENNWLVKSSNYTPWTVTTDKIPKGNIKNFYTPESVKQAQEQANQTPTAKKYANGNIRTVDGVLIKKEDAYKVNKDIIGDKSYEAMIASEDMKTAWDTYKWLIDKYGVEVMPWSAKWEMATAYNGVLRAAQKFFALGVFQPYDQKAIEEMIPRYAPWVGGTLKLVPLITQPFVRSGLSGKRKGFEDFIQNKINNEYDSLTRKYWEYGDTLGALKDVNAIYQKISDSSLEDEYVPTND
jgi:hypothetical protein